MRILRYLHVLRAIIGLAAIASFAVRGVSPEDGPNKDFRRAVGGGREWETKPVGKREKP